MDDLFRDRWTLITGAWSGIGEAFARALAARGAHLVLTARSEAPLMALARELAEQHGIRAEVIAVDLAVPGGVAQLCTEVARRGLTIDHLISNAGFGTVGPFGGSEPARQAEMVRLNCEALVALSGHFLPAMLERRSGGIIHVASIAGFQPVPLMATYGASKAFVLSFSAALSEEVRGTGVRILALCPGPVPTGFQAVAGSGIASAQRASVLSAEETVRRAISAYARGRAVYVPGALNRMTTLAGKLLPRPLLVRTARRMMSKKRRTEHPSKV